MRRLLQSLFALLISLVLLVTLAVGQSGRKQKKADPTPPVQGVNQPELRTTPEPEIEPDKPKEKEKGPALLISTGMADIEIPNYLVDVAREGCVRELRDVLRTAELRDARNQNRSDAIKTAKDEDRTYVVFLELLYDRYGTGQMNGLDLRYTIFEPKTGKVAGTGTGYPVQPSGGMPVPPIGASRTQVYLEWAARDVAQQVIKRLKLRP